MPRPPIEFTVVGELKDKAAIRDKKKWDIENQNFNALFDVCPCNRAARKLNQVNAGKSYRNRAGKTNHQQHEYTNPEACGRKHAFSDLNWIVRSPPISS